MKKNQNLIAAAAFCLLLSLSNQARAQTFPVVHWINDSGADAPSVLNTNGVFVTDFKSSNDFKVTPLGVHPVTLFTDIFGGVTPGNNPWYCTEFVGAAANGTGDGQLGDLTDLNMTSDATSSLQFDFLTPLTPEDRILLIDIDGTEQYQLQAYVLSGGNYVPVSLAGWTVQNFSGTTSAFPDSRWPLWNPTNGTATSAAVGSLNEELAVLIPDHNIDRLVVSKLAANGESTDITFESLALPLAIQQSGPNVVLTWSNAPAQNYSVVHWINESGQNAATVLNSGAPFLTDFKSQNDFQVTPLTLDAVVLSPTPTISVDVFGGPTPGNNPPYTTQFVGFPYDGTGDGIAGDIENLEMTFDATCALQFDFLTPFTSQDRLLLVDIDGTEEYTLEAFVLTGSNYNPVSFQGWTAENFTGTTGELPNSSWPIWNPTNSVTNATAISGGIPGLNLDQELFVLTPDQNINRLQIFKTAGAGWATDINFETASSSAVTPAVFTLQASASLKGPFTNIVGAASPYTNAIGPDPLYFRLVTH